MAERQHPAAVPSDYTLADIADLTLGYLDGCPTYTGKSEGGIVVLGFPRDSFWKHTRASWSYDFIANLPQTAFAALLVNLAVIILIYIIINTRLLKSVEPITKGIQDLAAGECVRVAETGLLCEISANLNRASDILREQREQLKKKETARASWIAGVSHDIRTPLTTVMGCAAQLEASDNLTPSERKKAAAIVRQSGRMRNLIDDLNLASKLEYDMQPLAKKQVNAVAVMRQVAADFMNAAADERHPIVWQTDPALRSCIVEADADLLSRAAANLIQNSIVHNEAGCTIYIAVTAERGHCVIRIEDSGVGAADEQIAALNAAPPHLTCAASTPPRHGLGLLIVKQIMSAHSGEVQIAHSEYGGLKAELRIAGQNHSTNAER